MRVAFVNGHQDHANTRVEPDSEILQKRGCEIGVFSFQGGHQRAPEENAEDALAWILGIDEVLTEEPEE